VAGGGGPGGLLNTAVGYGQRCTDEQIRLDSTQAPGAVQPAGLVAEEVNRLAAG
jgi:hypothetical protein